MCANFLNSQGNYNFLPLFMILDLLEKTAT